MFDPRAPKLVERIFFREKQFCAHRKTFRFAGYINDQSTPRAVNENGLFSFPVDRGPRQQDPHRTELGLMGPQILLPFTQVPPIRFEPKSLVRLDGRLSWRAGGQTKTRTLLYRERTGGDGKAA